MLSKNQARTFFLGGTVVFFLIFLVLSWHTLASEVPKNTNVENLTEEVIRGKEIFDKNNCMGCHTILGEGAYYGPELTKVIDRKGVDYCKVVLTTEQPWAPRGRKMVAYNMSEQDANDVIAFLTWIGEIDLNGFPPEPDLINKVPNDK
ncbi:MAG: c-type cytochrome [Bacteroidetes bacterium]|nr:c-type cytochrome [Bacteroidota bacterium]